MHKHRARKRFGQNFLRSETIIHNIIQLIGLKKDDHVIEIGPGLGALTYLLLKQLTELTVIEIDNDLVAYLSVNQPVNLHIIHQDVLKVSFDQWPEKTRIIGNLPYNISTPLIFHLLTFINHIDDMHFMLQKEVVERLSAKPNTKDYGRLSLMIQFFCDVTPLIVVPPEAFDPAPKVYSQIVRLKPHTRYAALHYLAPALEKVLKQAFSTRRKTVANTLKPLFDTTVLTSLSIDSSLRPEALTLDNYLTLAKLAHDQTIDE